MLRHFDKRFWTEGNASLFQLAPSQRLPQTRWLQLGSCDKSGTVPDSWLQELHGDFGMLYPPRPQIVFELSFCRPE